MAATGPATRAPQNLELPDPTREDKRETRKALKKYNELVIKHAKDAKDLHTMVSYQGPQASAKPGEIRKETFTTGAIITQTSPLIRVLPFEVLHRITTLLPLANFVALSLTCKTLAAHASASRAHTQVLYTIDQTAKAVKRGKPLKATTVIKAPPHTKLVRLAMLIQLKSWFPTGLALCYRCLRYKTRGVPGWNVNADITRGGLANQRAINFGPKCPTCAEWTAISREKDNAGYTSLVAGVKKWVK